VIRPIPILMFHSISVAPRNARTPSLYLSPRRFRMYLATLARLGFRGVSMGDAAAHLLGEPSSRSAEKLVALTFDDGYADNVEAALPILREFGFTATCYVASDHLGGFNAWDADVLRVRTPMMTREQLSTWRGAGMDVGAHTRSHCDLSTCSDAEELRQEVAGSKTDLECMTGGPVTHFSYPFGRYGAAAVAAVRAAGFATAVSVRDRRARATDDPLQLPRLYVGGNHLVPFVLARALTRFGDWERRED
jgi:peptidoglycan/xylan/chitin deacetylase (PgdA/CDA1 family)